MFAGFDTAIVKLTAFCNLNCTYCYMFNQADQTFNRMPRHMSLATANRLLDRILEHLEATGRKRFTIHLHGGEPLLWPLSHLEAFLERVSRIRASGIELVLGVQTNGLRLPMDMMELCFRHDVSMGISIDGPAEFHDQYRIGHDERASYDRIMSQVESLVASPYGGILQGFLSVINPQIPERRFLDWVASLPVTRVDVLWPIEYHHGNPQWSPGSARSYRDSPVFGVWMANLFELWWQRQEPDLYVRTFFDTVTAMLGSPHHMENLVNDQVPMVVVNTDGAYEYHDYFRSHKDGASETGLNLWTSPLDVLGADPVFQWLGELGRHLPDECGDCAFSTLCGGGFLPGRMDPAQRMPRRRSVLCADQYHFLKRVHQVVSSEVVADGAPDASRVDWRQVPPRYAPAV